MFSPVVTDHWLAGHALPEGAYAVVVEEVPPLRQSLQLLEVGDGGLLRLTPERARQVGVEPGLTTRTELDAALAGAGLALGSPDQLHYLPHGAAPGPSGARVLGADDADAFAALVDGCSPDDVEEAYVELGHDLVVGTVDGDRLVSAASAYRWHDTPFGDIGILTAPDARGRGHGAATVRAMAREVAAAGLEPQYRCDDTNAASAALAARVGFRLFARWALLED
ncbi:GNAT family N-acetyltransferase [Nocardioides marmoraquaticus]